MTDQPATMKALVFHGKCTIALVDVPLPTLETPTDAIVCISLCGLCGSDMHPYHCREVGIDHGTICGHEFTGTIHQLGSQVTKFSIGERVMSPFTTNCGSCFYCRRGLTARCTSSGLFGWVENGQGLHGAQTQFIRVPMADSTLMAVPLSLSDEEALLLGDVFSTGFFCAENGEIEQYANNGSRYCEKKKEGKEEEESGGPVVVVVGCGPVGLVAIAAAKHLGAATIFAIDSVPERLTLATEYGAYAVDRNMYKGDDDDDDKAVQMVMDATEGRGGDVVLEAVGLPPAFDLACRLVRPGGVVSVAGCHSEAAAPMSLLYNKNFTVKSGRCSARYYMERLLPLLMEEKKKVFDFSKLVTHRLPLTPDAYTLFDSREDGVVKVVMNPWL